MIFNQSTTECKVICSSQMTEDYMQLKKIEERVLITTFFDIGLFQFEHVTILYFSTLMCELHTEKQEKEEA